MLLTGIVTSREMLPMAVLRIPAKMTGVSG